ncbi:MAG: phage portal protein, partial [Bacilli bacterium]
MKTFQDFEKLTSEEQRKSFILEAINEHKSSSNYKTAKEAGEYDRQLNTEIMKYQKYLKNLQGGKIADIFAPNNKIASNFFNQFTNQENQYELSNGVDWSEDENADEIAEKLGAKFDTQLQKGGKNALLGGTSYGFFNNGKLLFFGVTEFVPLIDELNGELRAGIRFWQLDNEKPLMITLYEEDGVTEYSGNSKELKATKEKMAYITITEATKVSESIKETKNYSRLPIIPLYSGQHHDSRLVGMKNTIDLYDRIFSEFGNDFDRYQQIYWVFKNCGGMDGDDIQEFITSMKVFGGAKAGDDDDSDATAHTIEIPYQARQIALDMLEKRMYKDYGAIDISNLSSNATQDEINSKYLPLDLKVDEFEYCIIEFLEKLLGMLGLENINPKFHRDKMESEKNKVDLNLNKAQTKQIETQMLLTLDSYLDDETFIKMLINSDIIDEADLIEMEK